MNELDRIGSFEVHELVSEGVCRQRHRGLLAIANGKNEELARVKLAAEIFLWNIGSTGYEDYRFNGGKRHATSAACRG